ncbi:hypothetical protein MIPYR_20462 [uncultured Microbacterium sp.]|uniref:Uncharacterized protein n=1 Tax=uncultured Microbacterium sp. TaxID=191216 RepID=A0A1Y5P0I6_9MICO|nr:hypothetical protein MIPYR_20462 [uncultured Microbacterium sp.]
MRSWCSPCSPERYPSRSAEIPRSHLSDTNRHNLVELMRFERLDLANWSTNTSSGRPTMAALIAQSGSGTVRIADRHRDRHWPRAGVPGPPPP